MCIAIELPTIQRKQSLRILHMQTAINDVINGLKMRNNNWGIIVLPIAHRWSISNFLFGEIFGSIDEHSLVRPTLWIFRHFHNLWRAVRHLRSRSVHTLTTYRLNSIILWCSIHRSSVRFSFVRKEFLISCVCRTFTAACSLLASNLERTYTVSYMCNCVENKNRTRRQRNGM